MPVFYIERTTGKLLQEAIYYEKWLRFFHGPNPLGKWIGLRLSKCPVFSKWVGYLQTLPSSAKKIAPFVKEYQIDLSEAVCPPEGFKSFNDFFVRKLKTNARPIDQKPLIIPADGRFLLYPRIDQADGFMIKGKKFSLSTFLQDRKLAEKYSKGGMLLARLCPTDYHRFHFPCDGIPSAPKLINGALYSVNPLALYQNINRLTENKRTITSIRSTLFGEILFCEIGATNVGSITQTYHPGRFYNKGAEKGFFSFGGSALLLLFEPNQINFSEDLQIHSSQHTETLCLMGQALGEKK